MFTTYKQYSNNNFRTCPLVSVFDKNDPNGDLHHLLHGQVLDMTSADI